MGMTPWGKIIQTEMLPRFKNKLGRWKCCVGIAHLEEEKNGIRIDKFGIDVCYKKFNPQNNLPFNFLIQKYFFHDNPTWNINYPE